MEKDQKQANTSSSVPGVSSDAGGFACRFPGVICGRNKTPQQLKKEFYTLLEEFDSVIAVKVDEPGGTALITAFPEGEYDPTAQVFIIRPAAAFPAGVFILASGREDLPAALEAKYALAACGAESTMVLTRGGAEPGSLAELQGRLRSAAACIAVAGTDTALPALAARMTQIPVIALPVSVGGTGALGGLMSLAGSLSCAGTGLAVVSADDGLGAGFAAARIINSKTF